MMYLYEFIKAIEPLRTEKIPEEISLDQKAVVFSDYSDRKIAEKYVTLPEKGDYFQLYSFLSDPTSLFYKDVTPCVEYINKFEIKTYSVPKDEFSEIDLPLSSAAFYEAAYLFDYLIPEYLESSKNLQISISDVFPKNNVYLLENPILDEFKNNPLNLKVCETQIIFFFVKYIECRFAGAEMKTISKEEFVNFMKNGISDYFGKGKTAPYFEIITNQNKELCNFVQQFNVIGDREKTENFEAEV